MDYLLANIYDLYFKMRVIKRLGCMESFLESSLRHMVLGGGQI